MPENCLCALGAGEYADLTMGQNPESFCYIGCWTCLPHSRD